MNFPTDTDGFLSQECPSCEQQFKVIFGQGSEEPISYCPYCGYNGEDCWYTQPQLEHIQSVVFSTVLAPELKKLDRQVKGMSKGFLKIDMKSNLPTPSVVPIDTDDLFEIFHFPCCGETVKAARGDNLFCIICGTEINMTASDSKKSLPEPQRRR